MLKIDIASRLSNEFGDSSTDVDSLNLFRNWIDEVWLDIQSRFPWLNREATYNQTISNGVATLALNTNIKRIKSIRKVDTNNTIIFKSKEELDLLGLDLDATGEPFYWYYDSYDPATEVFTIKFYHVPDKDYSIEIRAEKKSQSTIADNEHIDLPNELLTALFHGVRALACIHEELIETQVTWETKKEHVIMEYKRNIERNPAHKVISGQDSDLHFGGQNLIPHLNYPEHIG